MNIMFELLLFSLLVGSSLSCESFISNSSQRIAVEFLNLLPKNENVIFSPASIAIQLGLLTLGSKGATEKTLKDFLAIDDACFKETMENYILELRTKESVKMDNYAFFKKGYKTRKSFSYKIQNLSATVDRYDFESQAISTQKSINEMIEQRTDGKIKETLKEFIPTGTLLFSLNTLTYNSIWQQAFGKFLNGYDFQNSNGEVVKVPFMGYSGIINLDYYNTDEAEIVSIPYNNDFNFVLFLPQKGKNILRNLDRLFSIFVKSRSSELVDLRLPLFGGEYDVNVKTLLLQLGLFDVFDSRGDFSNIRKDIKISNISHHVFLDVNEKGVKGEEISPFDANVFFKVDRPFVYFIVDKTYSSVLLAGTINNLG